jgi:hypothetical protein
MRTCAFTEENVNPLSVEQRQGAQIINSMGMVRMFMGVKHRIKRFDLSFEQLGPHITAGINQDLSFPVTIIAGAREQQ